MEKEKINLTDEQSNIIKYVKDDYNLIIKARAGCAKTTTCLYSIKKTQRKKSFIFII